MRYLGALMALAKLEPGQVFAGDFEVLRPLAEGGMGAVYVARQLSTGHERALKVMHASLASDALGRAKFEQEARVGARVESDHVVQVVAAGYDAPTGTPWLAMELLRGEDLASLLKRRGGLPTVEARTILSQVGHALSAAHRIGLVHRDLKPENVFVAASRRTDGAPTVKVLDFGIAKVLQENRAAATATTAMGSPTWMSPEQSEHRGRISPATDVWALGLVAFTTLTGRSYWVTGDDDTASVHAVMREVLFEPIAPASERAAAAGAALPPGFDAWFSRCVVREPERRFRDAGEATAALMGVLDGAAATEAMRPSQRAAATAATMMGEGVPSRTTAGPAVTATAPWEPAPPASRSRSRVGLWLALAGALLVLGVGAAAAWVFRAGERERQSDARLDEAARARREQEAREREREREAREAEAQAREAEREQARAERSRERAEREAARESGAPPGHGRGHGRRGRRRRW
ncbi:MAG: serine/threonine-protein kinase [Polyangiales bacterium]